jgi:cell wall-associated NlpC family hydrolase
MVTPNVGLDLATSTADATSLASTGYTLDQIDLSTGSVLGDDVNSAISSDTAATLELSSAGGLVFDPSALAAAAIAQQNSQLAAAQAAADASGCPTSAPANTLRGGATDIATLCAQSVAQARSPQAAAAIKAALNNLGAPYSEPHRNDPGQFDCSSFVTRMYDIAGVNLAPAGQNAPTASDIASAPWAVHIPYSQARPGDLVEPTPGHVVMLLADNYLVETSLPGDVSHVTARYWGTPYLTVWIDPSKV